jgi:hypothetical protein
MKRLAKSMAVGGRVFHPNRLWSTRACFDILLFVLNEGTGVPAQHAKRRGGHDLLNSLRVTEEFTVLTPRSALTVDD